MRRGDRSIWSSKDKISSAKSMNQADPPSDSFALVPFWSKDRADRCTVLESSKCSRTGEDEAGWLLIRADQLSHSSQPYADDPRGRLLLPSGCSFSADAAHISNLAAPSDIGSVSLDRSCSKIAHS